MTRRKKVALVAQGLPEYSACAVCADLLVDEMVAAVERFAVVLRAAGPGLETAQICQIADDDEGIAGTTGTTCPRHPPGRCPRQGCYRQPAG